MNLITALILGIVQGVLEFLPVSSFGHMAMLSHLLKTDVDILEVSAFLHVGTMLSLIGYFRKDILRLIGESILFIKEAFHNLMIYRKAKRSGTEGVYVKLIRTNYRKMAVMMMIAAVPGLLVGFLLRNVVILAMDSALFIGAGFFISGLVLWVSDLVPPKNLIPKDISLPKTLLIGLFHGLSVFPGLSESAMTITAASFAGLNRKNAVRFAYLLSIPMIIGASIAEIHTVVLYGDVNTGFLLVVLPGMLISGIVGYYTVRLFLRSIRKRRFRPFAIYSFFAGALAMAIHFIS